DSRRDEEDQLLIRRLNRPVFEQVAEVRDISEQWHLRNVERVGGLDDAADHDRAAICDQDLSGRLLGNQGRVAIDRFAEIRRRVFHVHVQEDRAFRRDLRSHSQAQERVDIGNSWRTAQLSLRNDWYAHALFYDGLDVVLRDHARTRENLQQTARLRHGKDEV